MKFGVSCISMLLFCFSNQFGVSEADQLPNFYPFGKNEGDQVVPPNDDGSSGEVHISIPFPFFDQNHKSLFVNTNGVISFLVQVSQYTPDAFPLGNNRRLVAPFWADVDTRVAGQVFYRETVDPGLLQQATDDIRATFVDHGKFKATWLLIATWYNVAFYGASGENTNKRNTFQAALITNGRHSFVIFNYDKVTWTTGTASEGSSSGLGGTPAQAGFNAGDGVRYFNIPGSRTHQVLDLPNQSNVADPGRWIFRVDNAKIEAADCNTKARGTPWYIFAVPSVTFLIVGVIIVVICFLFGSRRKRSPGGNEQASSQVGTNTEDNSTRASPSDVKEATTSQGAHEKKIA